MSATRDLIQKAYDQRKLRYPPDVLDFSRGEMSLELNRTGVTGTEFGYDPHSDTITYAWRSIDGTDIEPSEFLEELRKAVGDAKWGVGDAAWLTVPSRDSSGFSKQGIGALTIPVTVVEGSVGNNIQITPEGGKGTARVKADRLTPRS